MADPATLSRNLEESVRQKVKELQQAESLAAIGQMVSVVAHEIRNPLQNIQMGIGSIRKELEKDTETAEILEEIDHGVHLLNDIIKELLEYSRPVNLEYTTWRIRDIIKQAVSPLDDKLRNTQVHLKFEHEDREIAVDAAKMVRVFVNLITNAAESMPQGGDLRILSRFFEHNGTNMLKLSISDTGCGIDEKDLERIQQPFVTTKSKGTGLGISICKKIIEAHNGKMHITSKINEGTTVEILLPASDL